MFRKTISNAYIVFSQTKLTMLREECVFERCSWAQLKYIIYTRGKDVPELKLSFNTPKETLSDFSVANSERFTARLFKSGNVH